RLQQIAAQPLQRIGLSATQKPIEEVARFLVGLRNPQPGPPQRQAVLSLSNGAIRNSEVAIVDEGHRRGMDLGMDVPRSPLDAVMSHEVWEEYFDRLTELIAGHRTTLV